MDHRLGPLPLPVRTDRILALADAIERALAPDASPTVGFNMGTLEGQALPERRDMTGHSCGTVCCILGWVYRLWPDESTRVDRLDIEPREILGMFYWNWDELIMPPDWRRGEYSAQEAVAVLRHLAETGSVDWDLYQHLRPASPPRHDHGRWG